MDFSLSKKQHELLQTVRELAEQKIKPMPAAKISRSILNLTGIW